MKNWLGFISFSMGILLFTSVGCFNGNAEDKNMHTSISEAVKIATNKARDLNYNMETVKIIADDKNSPWTSLVKSGAMEDNPHINEKLSGKDFWLVKFVNTNPKILGGGLLVFVDRNNGDVILTVPMK